MPEITDKEFVELQRLRNLYSANSIKTLEDDIDAPIKNCVAALALLGCQPRWSCCGFDYVGQPLHKDHTHGQVYFAMLSNLDSEGLEWKLRDSGHAYQSAWKFRRDMCDGKRQVSMGTRIEATWKKEESIHYSEQGATYIKYLEEILMGLVSEMATEARVTDTNKEYRERFSLWQYPPKNEWVIDRAWLIKSVANGSGPKR